MSEPVRTAPLNSQRTTPVPCLPQLNQPSGDVPRHDDQRVLELTVGFGCQLAVNELARRDDFLTHSILQSNMSLSG